MTRFVQRILLAAFGACAILAAVIVARVWTWQDRVRAAFTLPPGTEVLCIGNSHTGCTWSPTPENHLAMLWQISEGFVFHVMRLIEAERRGALAGIRVCVMDLDSLTLMFANDRDLRRSFAKEIAWAWRYAGLLPRETWSLAFVESCLFDGEWYAGPYGRPDTTIPWPTRPADVRADYFASRCGSDSYAATHPARNLVGGTLALVARAKAICDRHGIRLVLFAAPLPSDNPERNRPDTDEFAALVSGVRSLGVEYLDLRTACPDDWFCDGDHLSRAGASRFTEAFWANTPLLP